MTDHEQAQVQEGGARVSVTLWTRGRAGLPGWRVRVTDQATNKLADEVVGRAVRAYNAVEAELAAARHGIVDGREPGAGPGADDERSRTHDRRTRRRPR